MMLGGCERYEPSSEPGISLPRFGRVADAREKRALFYSLSGSAQHGTWSGVYVDTEGDVWQYRRDSVNHGSTDCENLSSLQFFQCLTEGATLVAHLDQATMRALNESLRTIAERDREESDGRTVDGGYTGLIVTGLGTPSGKPIELGTCGGQEKAYSQIATREAEHVIDLYWRLLRGVFKWPTRSLCIGLESTKPRSGVRGWWMPH
jgi:hypothetical protein